jgi:hypothetical protein
VSTVEQREDQDPAFHDFGKKLRICIRDLLGRDDQTGDLIAESNHPPPRERVAIGSDDQVGLITSINFTLH